MASEDALSFGPGKDQGSSSKQLLDELLDEPAERFERRIQRAKKKEYSNRSVEDWTKHGVAHSGLVERLRSTIPDTVERCDASEITEEEFRERFERKNVPALIAGLDRDWPARSQWTIERLLRDYGSERFKVGEDDDGYAVYVKMRHYLRYLLTTKDDSPLYIFDSSFAEREGTRGLRHDYSLPKFFTDDLFKLVGERRRPPYRWLVIGPERSGSYIHIDPLGTSAWNALLHGHKCWALLPNSVPKEVVQPPKHPGGREAVAWFANVYPRLLEAAEPSHRPLTAIQRPGETMFVPGGWWHVVLNLDTAVAVTQNFCSRSNFESVWLRTRKSRPKMSAKLAEQLRQLHPELHARTRELQARAAAPRAWG